MSEAREAGRVEWLPGQDSRLRASQEWRFGGQASRPVPVSPMVRLRRTLAPHQAPAANHPGRTFRVATPCYRRVSGRKTQLVLGDKPDPLKHLDRIDQTIWEQYQVHLKRTTPLERAQFYARQMEARGLKSTAALERVLHEPFHRVWRALRLLELPEPVRRYLDEHRTPEMVRYFTERKLLALLKVCDTRAIWRRFQEMLAEAHREAGVWSQPRDLRSTESP